jgi:aminoglycoside phosphotransferase (APT) family kinase protein
MDLLQSELTKLVIADPATEVARNASALAAQQLRRLVVSHTELPELRRLAVVSYQALLPELRAVLSNELSNEVERKLFAHSSDTANGVSAADWECIEELLHTVTTTLLSASDATVPPANQSPDQSAVKSAVKLVGQLIAIDARLRDAREEACAAANQPPKPRSGSKRSQSPSGEDEARLLVFLQREFPKETSLRISRIEQIPGGYSKITWFLFLENNTELPDCLVMRRDGPYPGSSVVTEFPIINQLYAAGVAVPQPFAIDATGEVFGKPFILVARAAGSTIGDFVEIKEPSEAVALDLAEKMARMHSAPYEGIEEFLVGGSLGIAERVLGEIEAAQATWNSVVNQKSFVVQTALDWLRRNIDRADGPRTLLHRDIGFHNMMVCNEEVSAFLDWETAAVGAAAEDVGYTYDSVRQMIDWETFVAAYEAAAKVKLDRQQLAFYTLWGSVRIVVPICKGVDPVFAGTRKNLSEYYLGDHIVSALIQRIACQLAFILN